ncbi:hypothetical protein GGI12_005789, partial [Dipsacomyces acuminosporus]
FPDTPSPTSVREWIGAVRVIAKTSGRSPSDAIERWSRRMMADFGTFVDALPEKRGYNWETMELFLADQYMPRQTEDQAADELHDLKLGEDIDAFNSDFKRLITRSGRIPDAANTLADYRRKLPNFIKEVLFAQAPDSLLKAQALASSRFKAYVEAYGRSPLSDPEPMEVDALRWGNAGNRNQGGVHFAHNFGRGATRGGFGGGQRNGFNRGGGQNRPAPRAKQLPRWLASLGVTQAEFDTRLSERLCWICGASDHHSLSCPSQGKD